MTEQQYLDALFGHVNEENVRKAYAEPAINRAVKKRKAGKNPSYEEIFKSLKRASKEIADSWKLRHGSMSGTGLSKAAENRQVENLARSFMEIYWIRSRQ